MAAYVIAEVEVTDPAGFEEYRKVVEATLRPYGGKYLVRGGQVERLEGDWTPKRLVILEFDSLQRARQWYDSQEYHGPKLQRQKSAKTNVIIVEGVR